MGLLGTPTAVPNTISLFPLPLDQGQSLPAPPNLLLRSISRAQKVLPVPSFIVLHWTYFITTCLFSAVLLFVSSKPSQKVSFADCLFLAISAMTETGLNTINLSNLNTFQQAILCCLFIVGSPISVSWFVLMALRWGFEAHFSNLKLSSTLSPLETGRERTISSPLSLSTAAEGPPITAERLPSEDEARDYFPYIPTANTVTPLNETNRSEEPITISPVWSTVSSKTFQSLKLRLRWRSAKASEDSNVGRNANFHNLSAAQRRLITCLEYKAIKFLCYLVPLYIFIWTAIGCIGLGLNFAGNLAHITATNSVAPWWLGVFLAVSAFNNTGMSLMDMNMFPFQKSSFTLITMGLLTLVGNIAYPIILRYILKSMQRCLPRSSKYANTRETIAFILEYPRRIYTHLFPATQSWLLLGIFFFFTCTDWAMLEIMNRHSTTLTDLPEGVRALNGLFQAIAVRSSGFSSLPIGNLKISFQVLLVSMIYISVYPVAMSIRATNVYEEHSLGIYARETSRAAGFIDKVKRQLYFVKQHVQAQMSHDVPYIGFCFFLIAWIEGNSIARDPTAFSVFNVAFEVMSGYANCGLSIGIPTAAYSLSGEFHTLSKLIMCALMLRGRHRGLPTSIDKAIQLPTEEDGVKEELDERIRLERAHELDIIAEKPSV